MPRKASLTRKSFQKSTAVVPGTKTVRHHCSCFPGTLDYGFSQGDLPGLEDIGMASLTNYLPGVVTASDGRFLYTGPDAAIDHMLFSILLFHRSTHADRTRGRFLDTVFDKSKNQDYVCITKINAKKKEMACGPLFCLVRAPGGNVHVVLTDPKKPVTTFMYTYTKK